MRRGGREIFVFRPGEIPARVVSVDVESGVRTPWLELVPADSAGVSLIDFMWITPDGSSYVYSYKRLLSELFMIEEIR